jgi:hypothetical protein
MPHPLLTSIDTRHTHNAHIYMQTKHAHISYLNERPVTDRRSKDKWLQSITARRGRRRRSNLLVSYLVTVLMLGRDTITEATLIKKALNLGLLSEVQSIIIMAGSMAACRQTWCWCRWELLPDPLGITGLGMDFWKLKTTSNWHTFSMATPSNPSNPFK